MTRRWRLIATPCLLVAACGDPGSAERPAASAHPPAASTALVPAPAASSAEPAAEAPEAPEISAAPVESRRRTLRAAADDPVLYSNRDMIADKYGVVRLPLPLELQEIPLPRGRRALLLTGQGAALDKPLVLVAGADDTIVWSKDRPLAGTREKARELTLSRGPRGEVFLFWYDEPTKILAARAWLHDGSIFADFEILTSEGCDAVSVLHWPGRGWVAALLDAGTVRVQLLGENGTRVWPKNGVEAALPRVPSLPARPAIAVRDGDVIEVTAGGRKVQISRAGEVLRPPPGR